MPITRQVERNFHFEHQQLMPMIGTCVAFHPDTGTIGVVLFFPDWYSGLNRVDDGAAGIKRSVAVGC